MSIKLIRPFALLSAAGLLIVACGDESEVDLGSRSGAPAVVEPVEVWGDFPVSADGAIRRELAKLEAERTGRHPAVEVWGDFPVSADGAIRRELAKLEAERAGG